LMLRNEPRSNVMRVIRKDPNITCHFPYVLVQVNFIRVSDSELFLTELSYIKQKKTHTHKSLTIVLGLHFVVTYSHYGAESFLRS
jgi:hypothetical protein